MTVSYYYTPKKGLGLNYENLVSLWIFMYTVHGTM